MSKRLFSFILNKPKFLKILNSWRFILSKKKSKTHLIITDKHTISLVDSGYNKYLLISSFTGNDNSAYLNINSGVYNYAKFSYHPKSRTIRYAFTDKLWMDLSNAGKGRPNKERTKSIMENLSENQLLVTILVHESSLYRATPQPKDTCSLLFQKGKVFIIDFLLQNDIPIVNYRFLDSWETFEKEVEEERAKIYSANPKANNGEITGVAQLMNDFNFPWKMLCIGI